MSRFYDLPSRRCRRSDATCRRSADLRAERYVAQSVGIVNDSKPVKPKHINRETVVRRGTKHLRRGRGHDGGERGGLAPLRQIGDIHTR
jgi:hypothetical protein